jgi:two-component system, cell cycle response regulator
MNGRSATIFVTDDNPILLQGLERALVANGYEVRTAESGPELLEMLDVRGASPDLLLLDVMMPGMSGIDVLRQLHDDSRWADLPVVLITAANDDQLPVSALQHGAVDFLTKPFRLSELLARVDAHVIRYRELRRAQSEAQVRLRVIDVVRDLNSVVAAEEMFSLVTGRVAEICGVAECTLLIDEGETIRVAASSQSHKKAGTAVSRDAHPEVRAALESGMPVLIPDTAASTVFEALRRASDAGVGEVRSALAVPFPISERTHGVFLLRSTSGEAALGRESLEIAEQIVEGMSRALGRAQVFETLVEQRRQLHDLANTDELTGCASRRAVLRYLSEELDIARRRGAPLSVVMLDLDHFKEINDTFGHPSGDAVLRTFGEWLHGEGAHRARDLAGRIGGDEFLVVLPETGPDGAFRFAERANDYLASVTFVFGDVPTRASLSAGIAAWPEEAIETAESLIERADAALYRAKDAGRSRIQRSDQNAGPAPDAS